MLMPKRVKYRKMHRGHMRGTAGRGNQVAFGEFGLQAMEPCWMTSRQIEAARRTIVRFIRRGGKLWICLLYTSPSPRDRTRSRMPSSA